MKIGIVIPGFNPDHSHKQPWYFLSEVYKALEPNYSIEIVTDVEQEGVFFYPN